jgi:hypothetical protein
MKIGEMQEILIRLSQKHGNIDVFFDCPKCGQSFSPTVAVTLAAHLAEEKK